MIYDEQGFLNKLIDDPNEETTRLVYADWLDEHGESKKAEYLRALVQVRQASKIIEHVERHLNTEWLEFINLQEDEYTAYVTKQGLNFFTLKETENLINKATNRLTIDYNELNGDTIREKYEDLSIRLASITNYLVRASKASGQIWMCTSIQISSIFETMNYHNFKPLLMSPNRIGHTSIFSENSRPVYVGAVCARWHLYKHDLYPVNNILIGIGKGNLPDANFCSIFINNFNF